MQTKIAAAALVLMAVPAHAGTLKHDMRTYMDLAHKAYIFWEMRTCIRTTQRTKEAFDRLVHKADEAGDKTQKP